MKVSCVFIDIRPTCREVAFEQGSHRKEEEVLDDNKAPADPKELPRFRRKRGSEKYLPEEQKVILTIPEMSSYCIEGDVLLNKIVD